MVAAPISEAALRDQEEERSSEMNMAFLSSTTVVNVVEQEHHIEHKQEEPPHSDASRALSGLAAEPAVLVEPKHLLQGTFSRLDAL